MSKLSWQAAYSVERDDYITVEYALSVRDRNAGEYRENPCYNSKDDFEGGMGIKLTPVNMRGKKVNFFRSFPGQLKAKRRIASSIGMASNNHSRYSDSALRVRSVINFLLADLQKDEMTIDQMLLLSAKNSEAVNSLLHPDVIIHHRGDYSRRETRIFVKDHGRGPKFDPLPDDWILDITKIAPDIVTSWKSIRPLFMKLWKEYEAKRDRRVASVLDAHESEEATGTLDNILEFFGDANREEIQREIDQRLEQGEISSISVAKRIMRIYIGRMKPATFVDGNGIERTWADHSEIETLPYEEGVIH